MPRSRQQTGPALIDGPVYPQRPPFFAMKFQRLLSQVDAAQQIKPQGCWLLVCVANQEDQLWYRRPPLFHMSQLMKLMAMGEDAVRAWIAKCVEAGWLTWRQGTTRRPCTAWVNVPIQYSDLLGGDYPENPGNRAGNGAGNHLGNGAGPSYLILEPKPSPPTQTAPGGEEEEGKVTSDQDDLVRCLGDLHVWNPEEALRKALASGASREQIAAHIAHYQRSPGAWKAGALRVVLTTKGRVTGVPGPDTWPPPAPGWEAQQRADALSAQTVKDRASEAERAALAQSRRKRAEQLEFDFGRAIDALSIDELVRVIESYAPPGAARPMVAQLRRLGRPPEPGSMLRESVLRAFAAVKGS